MQIHLPVWLRPLSLPLWLLVLAGPASAQTADDLGGASAPKPYIDQRPDRRTDYKRWGQYAVKQLALGHVDGARQYLQEIREFAPDDPDLTFLAASAAAHAGEQDEAQSLLQQALRLGLPPGRIIAGPPPLSDPLGDTPTMRQMQQRFAAEPIHGPLLGSMTDTSVQVWLRTAQPADVSVTATALTEPAGRSITASGRSRGEDDHTVVLTLTGLQPETTYEYRVRINGHAEAATGRLTTFPRRESPATFTIAFGGGAGYHPAQERVWDTIRQRSPAAVLLLGDNVYSDDPETPAVQQYSYYRRQSRPEFRQLTSTIPIFSIWDDHDFGTDDSWGGPLVDVPKWKQPVWRTFRQNWTNPGYGGGEESPGVWYDFSIGAVDFFMLDGRYYRTNSGRFGEEPTDPPTMLGPRQNQWLRDRLAASRATFKVIVSPVPWDFRAKAGRAGLDTWRGYAEERQTLFSFLSDNRIGGVVLMSADRHRSDAWKIERPDDYPLYEFNSSRLTNDHVHPTMEEAIFSYNEKQSFGCVTFDTTLDDPTLTYRVISIDNEAVHSLSIKRSDLRARANN